MHVRVNRQRTSRRRRRRRLEIQRLSRATACSLARTHVRLRFCNLVQPSREEGTRRLESIFVHRPKHERALNPLALSRDRISVARRGAAAPFPDCHRLRSSPSFFFFCNTEPSSSRIPILRSVEMILKKLSFL